MSPNFDESYIVGLIGGFFVLLILAVICYVITALIYFFTAKTNGPEDLAFLAWIPLVNAYLLFAFGSKKTTPEEVKKRCINLDDYLCCVICGVIYSIYRLVSFTSDVCNLYLLQLPFILSLDRRIRESRIICDSYYRDI